MWTADSVFDYLCILTDDKSWCFSLTHRLRSCYINDRGFADLISALTLNPSHLRELDLSDNKITDSGVKQFSALLEDPQCKLKILGWVSSFCCYCLTAFNSKENCEIQHEGNYWHLFGTFTSGDWVSFILESIYCWWSVM